MRGWWVVKEWLENRGQRLMQVLCHFMFCIRTAYSDSKTQNKVGISIPIKQVWWTK